MNLRGRYAMGFTLPELLPSASATMHVYLNASQLLTSSPLAM